MEICYLEKIASTQIFLENALKNSDLTAPLCVWTLNQTGGIGSRNNSWQGAEGNLAFSFALPPSAMPDDLPPQSASLYFGFLFKETLAAFGSSVWMKWPNDLFINGKKVGGVITKQFGAHFVCGIGLNFVSPSEEFGAADIPCEAQKMLGVYMQTVEKRESWSGIFSRLTIEYQLSREHSVHLGGRLVSLRDSELALDGSVVIGTERVYSKR